MIDSLPEVPQMVHRSSLAAALIGLVALAGCGSSSHTTSSAKSAPSTPAAAPTTTTAAPATSAPAGAVTSLALAADPTGQLKFDTSSLTAKAGKVTIKFTNAAPLGHNLTIATSGGKVIGATPTFQGSSQTLTVTLTKGSYTFYCSVPGHQAAGMNGTLTVQ